MGQSLFARLVKLGVPTVQLDAQGRTRPEIACLYSWRYERLTDIPHVITGREYSLANPGLRYNFQVINVEDYKGRFNVINLALFRALRRLSLRMAISCVSHIVMLIVVYLPCRRCFYLPMTNLYEM